MGKPKIRFKGYDDDWEQRKLGEVIEDYTEKTTIENQYPVLTSSQQMGIVLQDDYFSGDRVSQSGNIGYFVIPRGYFAYRSRSDNDVFVFNRNDCIDKGIISYFYPVFKPYGVDSDFLLRRLNYGLERQLKIASEGTGQHVLSLKKFKNMMALFPQKEEQERIGKYFFELDHLITLHQRKCDETKKLKKYMLQKMFPQNGQTVPEIRFSGFTDVWEQRKLADVVDSVDTGKSKFDKEGLSGEYPILGSTSVIGYDDEYDYEGDFILTARVGANAGSLYRHVGKVKISDNTVFIQASQNIEFLYQLLIQFDIKKLSFGTGQPLVKASELKSLELMMPTDMKEQMQIGEYFKTLDHLITLHQQKCDELQNIKKFMLQNMFV